MEARSPAALKFGIYTHAACLEHDTGTEHVEIPQRLGAVIQALRRAYPDLDWIAAPRAGREQLLHVHDAALLRQVLDTPPAGRLQLDADTILSPGSPEAALRAAGAGIAAVDDIIAGKLRRAFCAVRPPGHHATRRHAMGFCLLNNIAIAAVHALNRHRLERVCIIDFDVHHGNGSQDIFEQEPRVQYLSSHQWRLYPDTTGHARDRGCGNIRNAPLPAGSGSARFRAAWSEILLPALDDFQPQLLLISAGFDGDRRDPLSDMELDVDDFAWLTAELAARAERHAGGRIVSTLEGGYDLNALAEGCVAHVGILRTAG